MRTAPTIIILTALASMLFSCKTPEQNTGKYDFSKIASEWQSSHSKGEHRRNWQDDFSDQTLDKLITEALSNNYDVKIYQARIDAAQNRAKISSSALRPTVDLEASSRTSRSHNNGRPIRSSNNEIGFSASWEIDLWNRLSHREKAAYASYEAAIADYHASQLSLSGQIAAAWFNLINTEEQLTLAEKTLKSFEQSQKVIESRFSRGLNTALDVRLGRSTVEGAKSRVSDRKLLRDRNRTILELLLGRYPGAAIKSVKQLPELKFETVPAGLPSELLNRRPDIIAAEKRLLASNEYYKEAEKNLLPRIRLTAFAGTSSNDIQNLLDPDYLVANIIGSLSQPIINSGQLKAEQKISQAELEEDVAIYAKVILQAFQEVEISLIAEKQLKEKEVSLNASLGESQTAEKIAQTQYNRGLVDISTLLLAQRRVFEQSSQLLDIRKERLNNRVNLYIALGGSFEEMDKEQ